MQLFNKVFKLFKTEPTELELKRQALANDLEGVSFQERCRILNNLMIADSELYISWMQDPY